MKKLYLLLIILVTSINCYSQIPTAGLAGYWPFNGNANDESGNGLNGTVTGATLTADRFGRTDSAYSFDGTSDYIYITNSTIVDGNSFTISLWFFGEAETNGRIISTGNQNEIAIGFDHDSVNAVIRTDFPPSISTYKIENTYTGSSGWHHMVLRYDGSEMQLFIDNNMLASVDASGDLYTPQSDYFTFGMYLLNGSPNSTKSYTGIIDDVRLYNDDLTDKNLEDLFYEENCTESTVYDTTIYVVTSQNFEAVSPIVSLDSTSNLYSKGGCDSTIFHYTEFVFRPEYYTDTLWVNDTIWTNDTIWAKDTIWANDTIWHEDTITTEVIDTTIVTVTDTNRITVYDSIAVTDTLIIDAVLTGIDPPDNINRLKVYPNPAREYLFINTGDYSRMNGYQIRIFDQLGSVVFETNVEESLYEINLSTWSGYGMYYLQLIDPDGIVLETRKIILE